MHRPKLLVVDDDRAILHLIGTLAQAEGFEVGTTIDGGEVLSHLRRLDHSPQFWKLVAGACPEYRQARQWLRTHANRLRGEW